MKSLRCKLLWYGVPVLSLLFFRITSMAQVGTLNMINPVHSPTAAALGKFVEMPVSYYSGVPSVTVPVYQFKTKDITVPISLDYHASGIKVKDVPGWVGTGWVLNAGGVISRIVKGNPDDHYPFNNPGSNDAYVESVRRRIRNAYKIGYKNEFTNNEQVRFVQGAPGISWEETAPQQMELDGEYDQYYFNFMGNSGRFTFGNLGEVVMLPGNNLKIEYIEGLFKITDDKGVVYEFHALEQAVQAEYDWDQLHKYISSWFLSRISIPYSNQEIKFNYRSFTNYEIYNHSFLSSAIFGFTDKIRFVNYSTNGTPGDGWQSICEPISGENAAGLPHGMATQLFLDYIVYNKDTVRFFSNNDRTDIFRFKLDSIKVNHVNTTLHKVQFSYGYFNNAQTLPLNKRLRLDSVQIDDQRYRFSYIDSLHGIGVPPFNTEAEDIWGYYNGEDENFQVGNSYPYITKYKAHALAGANASFYFGYANSTYRNSDYRYAQLGTLKSIQYPTGGKTVFDYEGNDYSRFSFNRQINDIRQDQATQIILDSLQTKHCRAMRVSDMQYPEPAATRNFVIHYGQWTRLELLMGLNGSVTYQQYVQRVLNRYAHARAILQRYNDTTKQFVNVRLFEVFPQDSIGNPGSQYAYDLVYRKGILERLDSIYLSEGQYRMQCFANGLEMVAYMNLHIRFTYKKDANTYNAGGLRIKKIQFISGTDQDTSFVKKFEYGRDDRSGGVLESPFSNIACTVHWGIGNQVLGPNGNPVWVAEKCMFINIYKNPIIPLGNAQGGVIGYSRVREILEDGSAILHYFTNGYDSLAAADEFVERNYNGARTRTRIKTDNSWRRGIPVRIDYFNDQQSLVKQDFSFYDFNKAAGRDTSVSLFFEPTTDGGSVAFKVDTLFLITTSHRALKVKDSSILKTVAGDISEVTGYAYDANCRHTYPVKISRKESRGGYTVTNYKYPPDYDKLGTQPVHNTAKSIRNLMHQHVIAGPVEQYLQKSDASGGNWYTIGGQYVSFKQNLPFADTVFSLRTAAGITAYQPVHIDSVSVSGNTAYQPVMLFKKYDNYGNVTEQAKMNDINEVFLWGYHNRYPVAKITGSTYDAVAGRVNAGIIDAPVSDQQLQAELNKIRTGLADSNVMVNTYTWLPMVGVTSETDPAGKRISYTYDIYGRLALVRDQHNNILKQICYNYHGQPEACNWFGNAEKRKVFTRSNCANDSIGIDTTYIVPAGTWFAATQEAADSLAMRDIEINGQAFANSKGRCVLVPRTAQLIPGKTNRSGLPEIRCGIFLLGYSLVNNKIQVGGFTHHVAVHNYLLNFPLNIEPDEKHYN